MTISRIDHREALQLPSEVPDAAPEADEARYTSEIGAQDPHGCREIYIYLYEGDQLIFREAVQGQSSTVQVVVSDAESRTWDVSLAPGDRLETGRPKPPPG